MSIYSMSSPTYSGLSRQALFDAAMSQPLSLTSTLVEQGKGGALESFGLGTVMRESQVPLPAPSQDAPYGFDPQGLDVPQGISPQDYLQGNWVTPDMIAKKRAEMGALSEDQYKASPYYRKDTPYDPGMTSARAEALASMDDAKKVREFYAQKRPFSSFLGNLAGQALDPINYVPIAGEAVKAAAVARMGNIAGHALVGGIDAAANTAIFGIGTAGVRAQFGDDVSWQATISQIATAALIGHAFGALAGAVGGRVDAARLSDAEQRLATLRTTQEARIALNEGIDAVVRGEDVRLSPNATDPMTRIASEMGPEDFRRWIDGTKLVDEQGNPLVLYHQTAPENVASIERQGFDLNRIGARGSDEGVPDGVFLKTTSENIGVGSADKPSQMEVYAAIRNPLVVSDREALAKVLSQDEAYRQLKAQADELDTRLAKEYDDTYARLDEIARAEGKRTVDPNSEIDALFARGNAELRAAAGAARARATEVLKEKGYDGVVLEKDVGSLGRSTRTIIAFNPEQTRLRTRTAAQIDTTVARPEPRSEGVKQAEASVAKPENTKALAAQFSVDPNTGSFPEEAEVAQLATEGRLTPDDAVTLAQAEADYHTGSAFAEALKSAVGCLL